MVLEVIFNIFAQIPKQLFHIENIPTNIFTNIPKTASPCEFNK
jgi:hypothetical protein